MKWVCFISVCGGNSFLLQNASKCHSTGIEIKPKFLACGNAKQLWSSIQLCTHSPWMHFLLDSGERVFCCNWAVSVWSMAATFQQFDQMLDWNWNLVDDHRRSISWDWHAQPTNQQCGVFMNFMNILLCSGFVVVWCFWFCEHMYLTASVAEEQWRRSVPSKGKNWIGQFFLSNSPFEGSCCAVFCFGNWFARC